MTGNVMEDCVADCYERAQREKDSLHSAQIPSRWKVHSLLKDTTILFLPLLACPAMHSSALRLDVLNPSMPSSDNWAEIRPRVNHSESCRSDLCSQS